MKLIFDGATNDVTGSKHLIVTPDNKTILLDCGLYQGRGAEVDAFNRYFNFDPAGIHAVVLSHAHIDHSGNIPLLVKQGFKGKIYCTPATFDLCEILLRDSAHIHENDIKALNRRREAKGEEPLEPLYTIEDVEFCLSYFTFVNYNTWFNVTNDTQVFFTEVGHILGSAAVSLKIDDYGSEKKILYTGDVGRYKSLLMRPAVNFPQPDYIITESTYGDKEHDTPLHSIERLLQIIHETCEVKKGKLLIPAFSLGRTQELIYIFNELKNEGRLPDIKIFVDSPLSLKATDIMRKHKNCLNDDVKETLIKDNDPFGFSNLFYIREVEDSIKLNTMEEPCIIISASGMAEAGRIKHHIKNNIENKNSCILFVGYCAANTLGGKLKSGAKKVKIFGKEYKVKIRIECMEEYSAHADKNELLRFLLKCNPKKIKAVFLVHGEEESKKAFQPFLVENGFVNVQIPRQKEEIEI